MQGQIRQIRPDPAKRTLSGYTAVKMSALNHSYMPRLLEAQEYAACIQT